ncbi:hypothetical protein LSAT2_019747 [Lamellibrachia satsuma]|nr:hypothetical protein LSAT2_019747 [Lamellibrachia satsuma]
MEEVKRRPMLSLKSLKRRLSLTLRGRHGLDESMSSLAEHLSLDEQNGEVRGNGAGVTKVPHPTSQGHNYVASIMDLRLILSGCSLRKLSITKTKRNKTQGQSSLERKAVVVVPAKDPPPDRWTHRGSQSLGDHKKLSQVNTRSSVMSLLTNCYFNFKINLVHPLQDVAIH